MALGEALEEGWVEYAATVSVFAVIESDIVGMMRADGVPRKRRAGKSACATEGVVVPAFRHGGLLFLGRL